MGNSCVNVDQDGTVGTACQCTTDNCNKDHQCECPSEPGLKCQVCGDGGICSSNTDNGVSMECPTGNNVACWYFQDGKVFNY